MFHRADARLRAWLAARANAGPRAPRRVAAEIDRLGALLRDREHDVAVQEAAIEKLQVALAASEQERRQSSERADAAKARLAQAEHEVVSLRRELGTSESDREARLLYIRELEAALESERLEAARWRNVLPRVRIRLPRQGALAARLKRLAGSLRARFGGARREPPGPVAPSG